jgi:hypothetical protein
MDVSPCVVIVPIMNQEEMKNWNGEGYEAIVMAEEWEGKPIEFVCQGIGMVEKIEPMASHAEIETARLLLEGVLCGLAYSLVHRPRRFLKGESLDRFNRYKNSFMNPLVNMVGEVTVPEPRAVTSDGRVRRVRKVKFGPVIRQQGEAIHPAPDPLLLAVKAAVVWSTRHQQRLLAGGEVEDDADSLSIQAEEEYVERLRQAHRPKSFQDLAARLGQPNAVRASATDAERGAMSAPTSNEDDA